MAKSLEFIVETVQASKHPFHQVDDRPLKAQKHRYERRKIKEMLRYSDWREELRPA
ncbi:MAG: hypothetical protein JWM68_2586 [Verrucomicrobiales bacterium]|nr:hypothetical protein [Verrucomicrobiales bacterium]